MRDWTCKVMVIEKGSAGNIKDSPTKIQKLVFIDDKGDKVQVALFNKEIERRKDVLLPFCHYEVSNATVKGVDMKYRDFETPYQWTINPRTYIEEASDPVKPAKELFCFTAYKDFKTLVDSTKLIDVIGQVIAVKPWRELQLNSGPAVARDVILIDESLTPFLLTLWDVHATSEGGILETTFLDTNHSLTLIATRVKVSSFEGISLSTRLNSNVMTDPPIPRAAELLKWATESAMEIQAALDTYNSVPWIQRIGEFDENIAIPVSQALNRAETSVNVWVRATAKVANPLRPLYEMACKACGYGVSTYYMRQIRCAECKAKSYAVPKASVNAILCDDTGTVPVFVEDKIAESLFGFRAEELVQDKEKAAAMSKELLAGKTTEPKLFHLKKFTRNKLKVHYFQVQREQSPLRIETQPAQELLPCVNTPESSTAHRPPVKRTLQFDSNLANFESCSKIPKTQATDISSPINCSLTSTGPENALSVVLSSHQNFQQGPEYSDKGKAQLPFSQQPQSVGSGNLSSDALLLDRALAVDVCQSDHAGHGELPQNVMLGGSSAIKLNESDELQLKATENLVCNKPILTEIVQSPRIMVTVKKEKEADQVTGDQLRLKKPAKQPGSKLPSS